MPIKSLILENFKGVHARQEIPLKPITVFIGPNSSGKSTCIHALACLSQTAKLTNSTRPLILDDEQANVHLGRFIEVIHTKSYSDTISLGLTIPAATWNELTPVGEKGEHKIARKKGPATAIYSFKSTKRTQDIALINATIEAGAGNLSYHIKQDKASLTLTDQVNSKKTTCTLDSGFFLAPPSLFDTGNPLLFMPIIDIQRSIARELQNTLYLGPFRQPPLRQYPTRGSAPMEVGPMGEATITLMANEVVQTKTRKHLDQIASWLDHLGLARSIDLSRVAGSDLFDVSLRLSDKKSFSIADLGYGLSQVLPVLVQCSFARKETTLLFEQPELHLHSLSARKLAKVFIDTYQDKGSHIIIETHAPELVKELLQATKSDIFSKDELVIYRVTRENDASLIKAIEVDDDFDIYENWEKGISLP